MICIFGTYFLFPQLFCLILEVLCLKNKQQLKQRRPANRYSSALIVLLNLLGINYFHYINFSNNLQITTENRDRSTRSKVIRQPSIEEDAKFIRQTIEEIERGSSSRYKEDTRLEYPKQESAYQKPGPPTSKSSSMKSLKQLDNLKDNKNGKDSDDTKEDKRKDADKNNGKKKSKSRARLEREQSKPSESDSDPEVDTVTVEIPRRRKRPRRPSERPRTPPTSLHSDSDGEVSITSCT